MQHISKDDPPSPSSPPLQLRRPAPFPMETTRTAASPDREREGSRSREQSLALELSESVLAPGSDYDPRGGPRSDAETAQSPSSPQQQQRPPPLESEDFSFVVEAAPGSRGSAISLEGGPGPDSPVAFAGVDRSTQSSPAAQPGPRPRDIERIAELQGTVFELERRVGAVTEAAEQERLAWAEQVEQLREELGETLRDAEARLGNPMDDVRDVCEELDGLKATVAQTREDVAEHVRGLLQAVREKDRALEAAAAERDALGGENARLRERLAAAERTCQSYQDSVASWRARAMGAEEQFTRASEDQARLLRDQQEAMESLSLRCKRLAEQTGGLDRLCSEQGDIIERLQDRLEARMAAAEEAAAALMESGLYRAFDTLVETDSTPGTSQLALTSVAGSNTLTLAAAVLSEMAVNLYETRVRDLEHESGELQRTIQELTSELASNRSELHDERRENGRLRGMLAYLQETRMEGHPVHVADGGARSAVALTDSALVEEACRLRIRNQELQERLQELELSISRVHEQQP